MNNEQERTNNGTESARTRKNPRVMCGIGTPSSVEVAGNATHGLDHSHATNQTSSSMTPTDVIHDAIADELAHLCEEPRPIHIAGAASAAMHALEDEYQRTYKDGNWYLLVPIADDTTPKAVA